jgi:hypothetical protein
MSREASNRVLLGSAGATVLFMLNWYVFVQRPANVLAATPEFIGKCALLWPAVVLVVGVVATGVVELRSWGRPRRDFD